MKLSVFSTLSTKLIKFHIFVKLLILFTLSYTLSACTGAGSGNAEVEGMKYGLRLSIIEGDDQLAKAGETFALPLKVLLSDTAGSPVQGVKVTFRQTSGEQATILTKTVVTSAEGSAETRIKAPDKYDAQMTIQAVIEETNLITEFNLQTTPTGTPSKILVQTSHGEIESAGVPFAYVFRLTDELNNTVQYNGTLTINFSVNTPLKSWAGNEPVLPNSAITCLFTNGVCTTASIYTLVNAEVKTYLTVSTGSLISEVNKEVTVLPSSEFQVVVATSLGGPAASATAAVAYEGATVLNTDMPGIDFHAAIADVGGNYLRDANAGDGIVWTAVKTNGTSFATIQPDLTPTNGGGSVHYGLSKTVITPDIVRIRASKSGLNSDDTGNIQVDPGLPSQFKVWTQHNGIENSGTSFYLNGQILDAKGNLCTTTATKPGISGSGDGTVSFQNPTFGSVPSIDSPQFTGYGGSSPLLNFFNGSLIPLTYAVLTKAQKDPSAVATKPTITMRVVMPAIDLVTTGFDLTGVTDPIIVVPTAPRRLSFRSDTGNNGNYADDLPCSVMDWQFYDNGDPTTYHSCLDAIAGSASRTLYTVIEDKGGNPLMWNGSAWEMTDVNGTPQPIVIDGWNPNGSSLFNFSPVTNVSATVFNPVQAGYSSVQLRLNDPAKSVNLATTYTSLISTGNVHTFFAETYDGAHGSSNLISAPNSFTLRLVARDATGNTVFGFNGNQSFSFTVSPLPTASPKGTAANFPSTIVANFVNGEALVTGLKLPNAEVNDLTTFTGSTSVNGEAKTTNTVNITVDVGSVDSLKIRNNANNAGSELTSLPLTFNADTPPTLFVASYDSELNFYRDEVGTWSLSGAPLTSAISILTLAQTNPITPLPFCAGNNLGTIGVTVGSRSVSTGQVSITAGAYQQVLVSMLEASTTNIVTVVSAGTIYDLRVRATDQYNNTVTTFNGARNLTFTTSGNGTTRKGYNQSLPAVGSYNFSSGEVSPKPTVRLYNSSYTPRIIVDETTSVPSKNGQTAPLTVLNDAPYNFYINRSGLYLNAGSNAYFYTYLQDFWGNTITTGGQQNAQIRFYFDSILGGQEILSTSLASATINPATDEAIGNLNNGAASFQITAQKSGNLQPNAVLTSGPMPNANDINEIIVLPLTTVDQLQWVAGSAPQSNYTASKSVPFNEFKVEAVDIYGNRVTTDTSQITLSVINPSSGTTAGTIIGTTAKSLDQGTINFTDFKYPRAHNMTIRATHNATGKTTDANVTVAAGVPNQALVILQGQTAVTGVPSAAEAVTGSPATQVVNTPYPVTVYIMDEVFNPVLTWGNSISVGITDDSGANITPTSTNFTSGTATFNITSHKQGSHQIIPNATSILNNLTSSFFTVNPGAPTRLVAVFPNQTLNQGAATIGAAITNSGSLDQTAGVSFAMTVYATDNYFNIVNDSSTVLNLTLNNDPLATYGTSLPMSNGSVTFANIRYLKALASTQIGINVVSSPNTYSQIHGSSPFIVKANTATQTVPYLPSYQTLITGQPTLAQAVSGTIPNIKAGTNLTVRVAVTDDYFNLITNYTTPFTINLSDSNVTSPANTAPSSGEATFAGVQWITLATNATAQANATGLTNRSLTNFTVIPADGRQTIAVLQGQTYSPGKFTLANAVTWTAGAQTRTAGVSYAVQVYLTDTYFNTITAATDTVGINLTTDATAPAISTKSMAGGSATFTVVNTKADTNHTLRATSTHTNNNSTTFTVVPDNAYQTAVFLPGEVYNPGYTTLALAKTSTPSTQAAGTSFTATVRVLDQYFNVVNTAGLFTLSSNDINATISTTGNFSNGVGTAVITNYTANNTNSLTLSGTVYATQHNSTNYIVIPENSRYLITTLDGLGESIVPGKLTYAQAVSGTLSPVDADVAFNVSVSARDKYFNLINDTITVSITAPTDPFAILPAAKPLSNGIANFAIKNRKARNQYLAATGAGYTSVNSNTYWINWLADENLVILLPGQTLNSGAAALNINSTTHPNAIIGTPSAAISGQNASLNLFVTDRFFNQTDAASGSYTYSLTYNDDPYAVTANTADLTSSTAIFNYLPLRATASQKITPVLNTGVLNIYTTPFFSVSPGVLNKTEVLLPNQTLITGTTSRTIALSYPASYTTTTDNNFNVTVYALDTQHNQVTSANSTISVRDQADSNQATYNGNLVSGTATLAIEPVTPGVNHYLQVTAAPSISATHALSDLFTIDIGTPSKLLVHFPGQTFTPARRTGLQGLTGTITNQTVGTSFTADVIITDSKFNVVPLAWNINTAFLSDSYGTLTPSAITTADGSATVTVYNQVASASHQIVLTPTTGILTGVPFNSANYVALPAAAEQTILLLSGQTHTPGPATLAAAVTGTANQVTAGGSTSATVKLVDRFFNVVNSNAAGVSLTDSLESGHISPASIAFTSGIANFTVTPIRDGTHSLSTNFAGVASHAGSSLTVNAGAATQTISYFNTQTYQNGVTTLATAVSGSQPSFTTDDNIAVNIRVVDNYFNTVTSVNDTATLTTTDPVDTEATGAITGGVGAINISPVRAGTWAMASTVTGKTALNSNYTVTHGAVHQLVVKLPDQTFTPGQTSLASAVTPVAAADREAGVAFNTNIYLTDAEFNTATAGGALINAAWVNDSNGLINTATPLLLTLGTGVINVTPKLAGTNHKVRITPTVALTAGSQFDSSAFTVNPSTPAYLYALLPGENFVEGSSSITGSATTQTAGTAFNVRLLVTDSHYNTVTAFAGAKALSFTTSAEASPNSTTPVLATDTNYTFTNGETTVSGFTLFKAAAASATITVNMVSPALNKTTNLLTVQPAATLNSVKIKNAANNSGSEVTTAEYSTLDSNPTYYAAGFDAYGNFKADVTSTWTAQRSAAGDLDGALSTTSANSTQLNLTSAGPGTLMLTATGAGGVSDTTGLLTITEQGAQSFLAELETVGDKTAGTAFNLKLTARKTDLTSATSYAGVKTITLSSNALSGSAGCTSVNINPELPASATFTSGIALVPVKLKKTQTGVTLSAQTANITSSTTAGFNVNSGAIECLQLRTAASGTGTAITATVNLSALQNTFVYAHGYDANMNSLGDQISTWTSSGSVTNYYSPATGSASYARITGVKSGAGTLTATAGSLSEQIDIAVATGGATYSMASNDIYSKAHLLSNTIETGYMWSAGSDENTAWKTNASASWYTEAATNCAALPHRGCQQAFPDRVFVTVTDQEITLTDAKTTDLYMRFVKGVNNIFSTALGTAQSVTARNGKLYVGFNNGLLVLDFANDKGYRLTSGSHDVALQLDLRNNNAVSWSSDSDYPAFANYNFKHLKSYYQSSKDFIIAGLNQAIQVVENNAGTISVVNGPTLTGSLTAMAVTSTGGIYYGESGQGIHYALPNYASIAAFTTDAAKDYSVSDINALHVVANLSAAEATRDIIYMATQDGLTALHDHTTASQRLAYNFGLTSDGLSGFGSYLRHTSQTVSGAVSVSDHGARPSTDVTLEFFFKPQNQVTGARNVTVLVDKASTSATDNDFGILLNTNSSLTFYTYQAGNLYTLATANTTWNAQQWYHVVAQINSAGQMSLWIDGTLENTIDLSLTPDLSNAEPIRLYSNAGYATTAGTDFSFDELRVSNAARYAFNAATVSVPATPYTNDVNTSYLLHFDTNSLIDSSSANAAVATANGVHMVKPLLSGSQRAITAINALTDGSSVSGHIVSGSGGKLIELRNMQNAATMSESANVNSNNTLHVDYYNTTSPTNFDFIQWNSGTGFVLWAR